MTKQMQTETSECRKLYALTEYIARGKNQELNNVFTKIKFSSYGGGRKRR